MCDKYIEQMLEEYDAVCDWADLFDEEEDKANRALFIQNAKDEEKHFEDLHKLINVDGKNCSYDFRQN